MKKFYEFIIKETEYLSDINTIKKYQSILIWTFSFGFIFFYIYYFLTLTPVIHFEHPNIFSYFQIKEGNLISNIFPKVFNITTTESAMYRPRALGFFVEYIDVYLTQKVNGVFPFWGVRFPLVIPTMFLTIFSISFFLKQVSSKLPLSIRVLIGSSILFYMNYQVTTYVFLRTAKLMVPGFAVLMFGLMLKYLNNVLNLKKSVIYFLVSLMFFILITLDEQLIAVALMICLISFLKLIFDRKINIVFFVSILTVLNYIIYYLTWGKYLFGYYTIDLSFNHVHQFSTIFSLLTFDYIKESIFILWENYILYFNHFIFYIPFTALLLFKLFKLHIQDRIFILLLLIFAVGLMTLMIVQHSSIFQLHDLHYGMYILTAFITIILVMFFVLIKTESKYSMVLILLIIGLSAFRISNVDAYRNNHLMEYGGHLFFIDPATVEEIFLK